MDGSPDISELSECIAEQIGTDWFQLGISLKVPWDKLSPVNNSNTTDYNKAVHMFSLWLDHRHFCATRRLLIEKLEKLSPKVAFDYKKYLGKHYVHILW